ncbi:hypothetical protein ACTXT7_006875 [Hymenolepis weldensis]
MPKAESYASSLTESCIFCKKAIKLPAVKLDTCSHTFCFSCLMGALKNENQCPCCNEDIDYISGIVLLNGKQHLAARIRTCTAPLDVQLQEDPLYFRDQPSIWLKSLKEYLKNSRFLLSSLLPPVEIRHNASKYAINDDLLSLMRAHISFLKTCNLAIKRPPRNMGRKYDLTVDDAVGIRPL